MRFNPPESDGHPETPDLIDFDTSANGYSARKPAARAENRQRNERESIKQRLEFLESRLILLEEDVRNLRQLLAQSRAAGVTRSEKTVGDG